MTTKKKEITPETEDKLMGILTNEPSEPIEIAEYGIRIVFQRPAHKDKYKGRVWATKKLKEFGFTDADKEDPQLASFIRLWGTANVFTKKILVEDEDGDIKKDGKSYSEYSYNPEKDLDYSSVLEKYAIEEVYNQGMSDEVFISDVIIEHSQWIDSMYTEEDDLKNS